MSSKDKSKLLRNPLQTTCSKRDFCLQVSGMEGHRGEGLAVLVGDTWAAVGGVGSHLGKGGPLQLACLCSLPHVVQERETQGQRRPAPLWTDVTV